MNNILFKFSVLTSVIFLCACNTEKSNSKEDDSSAEQSVYLDQEPPGLKPEPFAPRMVTTSGWETYGGFTPDLKEFYFLREGRDKEGKSKMELMVVQNNRN